MRSLSDPSLIVQIAYGLIALPLYIATFVAIIKTKARRGTFFRFYVTCGIVNVISYLVKFLIVRLPLYTCGSCYLFPYFMNTTYWWLPIAMYVHWHTILVQPIMSTAICFDRFVVLLMKPSVSEFWKKRHLYFIVILLVIPVVFTHSLIGASANYGYLPDGNNFRVFTTGQFGLLFEYYVVLMAVTTGIGAFLNFGVFLQFFLGKIQVQGAQKIIEIKLFCNSVAEIITESCATAAILYQTIFLSGDPILYEQSRVPLLFTVDAMTLLPPFVIIFTCTDIRHYLFPCSRRRKVEQKHATITAQHVFEKHQTV